jgi:hypothetical protein
MKDKKKLDAARAAAQKAWDKHLDAQAKTLKARATWLVTDAAAARKAYLDALHAGRQALAVWLVAEAAEVKAALEAWAAKEEAK